MIEVKCACGTRLRLGDEWAGKQGRCPKCAAVLLLPNLAPAVVVAPPPFAYDDDPPPVIDDDAPPVADDDLPPSIGNAPPGRDVVPRPPPVVPSKAALPTTAPPVAATATTRPQDKNKSQSAVNSRPVKPALSAIANSATAPAPPPEKHAAALSAALSALAARLLIPKPLFVLCSIAGGVVVLVVLLIALGSLFSRPAKSPAVAANDPRPLPPEPPAPRHNPSPRDTPLPAKAADTPPVSPPDPVQAVATSAADNGGLERPAIPAPDKRPKPVKPRHGMSGVSVEYDDFRCQRIQGESGVRVPAAATIIEVDGERLPLANLVALQDGSAPVLFLPRGTHAVRWRPGEQPVQVTIAKDLAETYIAMRTFFDVAGKVKEDELFSRGARAMDVHGAPFLLNWVGASYAIKNEWPAAERKFRRSLRVNPLFGPAHLNLAHCLAKSGQTEEAKRELLLADVFNVGNCFGIAEGIANLRRELKIDVGGGDRSPVTLASEGYVSREAMSEEDRRLVALVEALAKYAVREEERGKLLNNLGVHFADTSRSELALEYFRSSLGALKLAGPERFELARKVLSHMTAACRRAKFAEAEEYQRMQEAVTP